MAKRKKPDASTQGTLFGPADVYGGHAEPAPVPPPAAPEPPRWDEGLTPPTAEELAALRAAHPGVMLLFRHLRGCAFYGVDASEAQLVAGLPLCGTTWTLYAGWPHGDFERHMRKLLRAGKVVAVVERGEGLPPGHRLGAEPVITPFTAVGEEAEGG